MSGRKSKLQNSQFHSLILATKEKEFYTLIMLGVKSIKDPCNVNIEDIKTKVLLVINACVFV